MEEQKTVFHLGLTMAGAVSAGAYTAGVVDYLFETLDLWNEAKDANHKLIEEHGKEAALQHEKYDHSIPMHDVVIDVMGGASAGSMCALITLLSLGREKTKVTDLKANNSKNLFYDAWVNLNDPNVQSKYQVDTFSQLLSSQDEMRPTLSLLNTSPIDQIGERLLEQRKTLKKVAWPQYVNRKLDFIMTLTSLRGAIIKIFFSNNADQQDRDVIPAHAMKLHRGAAHYTLDLEYGAKNKLPLDLESDGHLKASLNIAKASGAFPVGLRPRFISAIKTSFVQAYLEGLYPEYKSGQVQFELGDKEEFELSAVDGGTLNNEPFEDVDRILNTKIVSEHHKKAHILIDPFPNFETTSVYKEPKSIASLIGQIIGAILGQARVKDPSQISNFIDPDNNNGMIFPSRRDQNGDPRIPALATSGLDGFAGFIKREFREHDYQLGRRNCQSFLRNYFNIPQEKRQEYTTFGQWKEEEDQYVRFCYENKDGDYVIPIIPDLRKPMTDHQLSLLKQEVKGEVLDDYAFPQISKKELLQFRKPIRGRVVHLLASLFRQIFRKSKPENQDKQKAPKATFFSVHGVSLLILLALMFFVLYKWLLVGIPIIQLIFALVITLLVIVLIGYIIVELITRFILNALIKAFHDRDQLGNGEKNDKVV